MKLFEQYTLGRTTLANRIVMAPMTRSRAIGNIPNDLMATYYSQRADAGLLITEGTSPSPNGLGYARIPGLFNETQKNGWAGVTEAVHKNGGKIFVQLMHTGRVSHPANMPQGARILAPSAIRLGGKMWTDAEGMQDYPVPAEMTIQEIQQTVQEYIESAALAVEAGFDGVELHGANGYLIEQFLNPAVNKRTDEYGGSPEGRMRFVLEIAQGVAAKIGADRTAIRISPYGVFNEMGTFDGIDQFYLDLTQKLSDIGLVYLHIVDHSSMGSPNVSAELKESLRNAFRGTYILSGGYHSAEQAEQDLSEERGDLVAFGRPFISNPDLVQKLKSGAELSEADQTKFYTPGPEGYIDYASLSGGA